MTVSVVNSVASDAGEPVVLAVTVEVEQGKAARGSQVAVEGIQLSRAELVVQSVREAIEGSPFDFPEGPVAIKVEPPLAESASHELDLPVALGILDASEQLPEKVSETLAGAVVAGTIGWEGEVGSWTLGGAAREEAARMGAAYVSAGQVPTLSDLAYGRDFATAPEWPSDEARAQAAKPAAPPQADGRQEPAQGAPRADGGRAEAERKEPQAGEAPDEGQKDRAARDAGAKPGEGDARAQGDAARALEEAVARAAELEERVGELEEQLATLSDQLAQSRAEEMLSEKIIAERNKQIESLEERLSAVEPQGRPANAPSGARVGPEPGRPLSLGDYEYRPAVGAERVTRQYEHRGDDGTLLTIRPSDEVPARTLEWDWEMKRGATVVMGRSSSAEAAVEAMNARMPEVAGSRRHPMPRKEPAAAERRNVSGDAAEAARSAQARPAKISERVRAAVQGR